MKGKSGVHVPAEAHVCEYVLDLFWVMGEISNSEISDLKLLCLLWFPAVWVSRSARPRQCLQQLVRGGSVPSVPGSFTRLMKSEWN